MLLTGEIVSQSPLEMAMYLFSTPRLSPIKIGEVIGDSQDFMKEVAIEFISFLQFEPTNILSSLKKLLKLIKLPKGLMADQALEAFSEKFFTPLGPFKSKDAVHHLAFSMINLNTCLHIEHENIPLEDFIYANKGISEKAAIPEEYLS